MKISPQNIISFKGYDAAPINALYAEGEYCSKILPEMYDICDKEKINLRTTSDSDEWTQDSKTIIEKDNQAKCLANADVTNNFISGLNYYYKIPSKKIWPHITGGNSFIGKLPNGEKWMMAGRDELMRSGTESIEKEYGIKKENIYPISNPNFHLDMFIRPIGYPYVLVNDPDLAREKLKEIESDSIDYKELKEDFEKYESERDFTYASCDTVCKDLEAHGFIPIRIAGCFGGAVNFMNAVVNKHKDGKISYITNSSECKNPYYTMLQDIFERDLREKSNIDKVYYVKGGEHAYSKTYNHMMVKLKDLHGGIHCMTMEEPNFKAWV